MTFWYAPVQIMMISMMHAMTTAPVNRMARSPPAARRVMNPAVVMKVAATAVVFNLFAGRSLATKEAAVGRWWHDLSFALQPFKTETWQSW